MEEGKFIIDKILGIEVEPSKYNNEVNTLDALRIGLNVLYNSIKQTEINIQNQHPEGTKIYAMGYTLLAPSELQLFSCYFHWFANTISNYCRLVGFLVACEKGEITEEDLQLEYSAEKIKKEVDKYVNSVEELKDIKTWRNKVSAHFALTYPFASNRGGDNIATLMASVDHPLGFELGRFKTQTMNIETLGAVSELPSWSLSEIFEKLIERYWPFIKPLQ